MGKKILILLVLLLICGGVFWVFFKPNEYLKSYDEYSISLIKKNNIPIDNYYQTLDMILKNDVYNNNYLEAYKEINFKDKDNFLDDVNILLDKNYSASEVNMIFEYLSDNNIEKLLQKDYINLDGFYQITNLDVDKIDSYLAYKNENNVELKDAVTLVNLHLNEEFYTNVVTVSDPDDVLVLVNKYHALPSDYVPSDLVNVLDYKFKMREVAAKALEELIAAALVDNRKLIPYSTYRSYDYQNTLYNMYLKRDGLPLVDTYSARPGHSEHQTGLACDIRSSVLTDSLTDSDYEWMLQNAPLYGFIVRYPKNGSWITGYQEEPWHIRYLGKDVAQKVSEMGITYDEYYDLYIEKR